jgi:TRAP-type C4-dicarboxylate transport system permease small subunit
MKKISDGLNRACEAVLVALLAAMTMAVFLQVVFRYLFHFPLFWTEELARYCLVWASLTGASIALKKGAHIAIRLLVDRFPSRAGRAVFIFLARSFTALILVVVLTGGIQLVVITSRQISPALRIPMAIPYSALPVCSAIMLVHIVAMFIHKTEDEERSIQH